MNTLPSTYALPGSGTGTIEKREACPGPVPELATLEEGKAGVQAPVSSSRGNGEDTFSLSGTPGKNQDDEIRQLKEKLAEVQKASTQSFWLGVGGALAMTVGGAIIAPANPPLGLTVTAAGVAAIFKATHIFQNRVAGA